jgi:hypothetical protein
MRRGITTVFVFAAVINLPLGSVTEASPPSCSYEFTMTPVTGAGVAYVQEVAIGPNCEVVAGNVSTISVAAALGLLADPAQGRSLQLSETISAAIGPVGGSAPLTHQPGGTHLARAVHQVRGTYDNSVLATETTHRQEFSYDSMVVTPNWMQTLLWWRAGTGWVNTGSGQEVVDGGGDVDAFTRGYGSYDNTSFPCNCQPCNHTTWSGVRSYYDGSWSPWFTVTGNLCSGWMYTRTVWWQEY